MGQLRLFIDEDVYGAVTTALRKAGFDVVSTPDTRRLGQSDESQLLWASDEQRAIVTFNVAHFANLHVQWLSTGKNHAGIIVSAQRPIGEVVTKLVHLASTMNENEMKNRLEFLSDW